MDKKRIKGIAKDLRHNLEDIIVKLNNTSPQQMHDDIVPLLEDLEMLEWAVGANGSNEILSTNPQFTDNMVKRSDLPPVPEVKGTTGDPFDIINAAVAGINGGSEPPPNQQIIPASQLTPSMGIHEAFEIVVRLKERMNIEMGNLPMSIPEERLKNIVTMKQLIEDLRVICIWLMNLDLPAIDAVHLDGIIEEIDKQDDEDEGESV